MEINSPLFLKVQQRLGRSLPRKLTEDEQAEIAYAFEKLSGGDSFVLARHVKVTLRAMGFPVKKSDVHELLSEHGLHVDASIDWQSFNKVVSAKVAERTPQDEVRRAFLLFDLNHTGKVTLKDLALIVKQLNFHIDPEELKDMISEFDTDGDGAISEDEFRAIMTARDD